MVDGKTCENGGYCYMKVTVSTTANGSAATAVSTPTCDCPKDYEGKLCVESEYSVRFVSNLMIIISICL